MPASARRSRAILAISSAIALFATAGISQAQVVAIGAPDGSNGVVAQDVYHGQYYPYSCAIASMEMELDEPQVTTTNAFVNNLIAQGDQYTQAYMYDMVHANYINSGINPNPLGSPLPPVNSNPLNVVPTNVQYNNANAQPGLNNYFYSTVFNPAVASGTDMNAIQFGLNVLNANTPTSGTLNLGAAGTAYASYNFNNGNYFQSWDYASRTMAACINTFKAPAVAGVLNGAHAISVYGVSYGGANAPGFNAKYSITGFYIHDPWTGYVQQEITNGAFTVNANKQVVYTNNLTKKVPLGLGENTWYRYGLLPAVAGAPTQQVTLANGNVVNATLPNMSWYNIFTPSGPNPSFYTNGLNAVGFKVEVEPQGPEGPDDGNGGQFASIPDLPALLPSQVTQAQADADAVNDLGGTGDLSDEPGFENGSFDMTDEMLLQNPSDPTLQGDWLVPYDGSGGADDVTGAVLVDEDTGVIDQATWTDPSDPETSMTLGELDEMYQDELTGNEPDDNEVPEPASLAILAATTGGLLLRRRRASSRIEPSIG